MHATSCFRCGHALRRVSAVQQKTLIDIILNPHVVQLIVESERQWCSTCRTEVSARDKQSLPFTEFGINTFMMALLLRYRCLLSLSKISMVFSIGYGLDISESGLVSLFRQAHRYLGSRYEELKTIIRKGEILYADETGWQVRGKSAWMWIMANEQATVYIAAESRGKGVATEMYGTMDTLLIDPSPDPTTCALQHRLREQKDGLIQALLVSPNGTNNFAEQELRPIALSRKISYGSDTYTGMETTAVLASVVQTLVRTKREEFFPTLQAYLRAGFANS